MKILLGGYIFRLGVYEQKQIGADKISFSTFETIEITKKWWNDKNEFKFK